jgi:ferredoxin
MRIHTETDRCIASGMRLLAAPEIFDQDDDG